MPTCTITFPAIASLPLACRSIVLVVVESQRDWRRRPKSSNRRLPDPLRAVGLGWLGGIKRRATRSGRPRFSAQTSHWRTRLPGRFFWGFSSNFDRSKCTNTATRLPRALLCDYIRGVFIGATLPLATLSLGTFLLPRFVLTRHLVLLVQEVARRVPGILGERLVVLVR